MVTRPAAPSRELFRHFRTVSLRWADNDAYGHVNNSIYYQWFDSAVNQWLVEAGLLDIAAGNPIALVVSTGCTYFDALSYPGNVEIGLSVVRIGSSSVTWHVAAFAPGEGLASAAGEFVHVAVDRHSRRPVHWPAAWRERYRTILVAIRN